MKKLLAGILVAALVYSVSTTSALAAGCGRRQACTNTTNAGVCCCNGTGYVDADGDGICDNCNGSCNYVDADGDGICDNCPVKTYNRNATGCRNGSQRRCRR